MGVVMKQFIDKFKAMEKIANETLAAEPAALVGVDSLPGSEHDAKVPEEAKKPDPEVTQGQPEGATSTAGAEVGGDAKPCNEGKLEMDQPLLNPEKKPLITDDALTAKVANDHLVSLVKDLLSDIGSQKQAAAKPAEAAKQAEQTKKAEESAKVEKVEKVEKKDEPKAEGEKKAEKAENHAIRLDDETISKIAAAQAMFMLGREAAGKVKKEAAQKQASADDARALIKAACIKAAQEQGLDPAAAALAADNAMAAAGMAPAAAADAGAADAGAAAADAGAAAADAGAAEAAAAEIPDDVTEEELATALVDLVSSGKLDTDTAKALVEEIAGDSGAAESAPSEDQAAEIIAKGIESGEITPEQAQQIAAAVEGGAAEDAASAIDAGAASAEAQGAADAEAAIQDAKDEAQGAADAEAAMKAAAEKIRSDAISKVASAIMDRRQKAEDAQKQASAKAEKKDDPKPGDRLMAKVASILDAKKAEKAASEAKGGDKAYIAGFKKKAEEMGVDPQALAKYIVESRASQTK